LEAVFGKIYASSNLVITGLPYTAPLLHVAATNGKPLVFNSFAIIEAMFTKANGLTTNGKFSDAINAYREILWNIPLMVLPD